MMKYFEFRFSRFPGFVFAMLLGGACFLSAQETAGQAASNQAKKNTAWVRCWVSLNDGGTYSFRYSTGPKKEETLFAGIKGDYRPGYRDGYLEMPAGNHWFSLVKDGAASTPGVEMMLEKEAGYTVIATLDHGVPKLRFIREFPTPPEESGIYIYKFCSNPLTVKIDEGVERTVTDEPFFLDAASVAGKTVTISHFGKRNVRITTRVEPTPGQRVSVLFMRNNYNQPSIFIFPSERSKE